MKATASSTILCSVYICMSLRTRGQCQPFSKYLDRVVQRNLKHFHWGSSVKYITPLRFFFFFLWIPLLYNRWWFEILYYSHIPGNDSTVHASMFRKHHVRIIEHYQRFGSKYVVHHLDTIYIYSDSQSVRPWPVLSYSHGGLGNVLFANNKRAKNTETGQGISELYIVLLATSGQQQLWRVTCFSVGRFCQSVLDIIKLKWCSSWCLN